MIENNSKNSKNEMFARKSGDRVIFIFLQD